MTSATALPVETKWTARPVRQSRGWMAASLAAFEISVGNPRCSGRWLEAQVRWATGYFRQYVVALGDELGVYEYMTFGHPTLGVLGEEDALAQCRREGDDWLVRNQSIIAGIVGPHAYRIVRWEEWSSMPAFREANSELHRLYQRSGAFRYVVHKECKAYARRRQYSADAVEPVLPILVEHVLQDMAGVHVESQWGAVGLYPGSVALPLRAGSHSECLPRALRERQYVQLKVHETAALNAAP